ncbi:hypothetical protein I6A60_01250 [Frankia sp. AgB1.9]|uniref:hypothetical protein n=1 Tax=unclassified Frankia TaxID=2632575 RepID=UPI001933F316|nr:MULTISPECIES: hypothetical protein [unclassified Frankia]MBL7490130.1 hypothetical protein [Frankia sp. AgW1.1]MBL7546513.1 hypothetical protein [Frankia sp. AgB1.9]MBL7620228.1 hypothetical protein [Frankia sp. AgB1.8]
MTSLAGQALCCGALIALDPARRIRSWTDGSSTSINHFTSSSGDSPASIVTGTAWTRSIVGIDGSLVASQDSGGAVTLQLATCTAASSPRRPVEVA